MRIRNSLLTAALVVSALPAFGRQWPDDPQGMVVPFGAPSDGGFSRGIAFRSEGRRVGAWNDGELIWKSDSEARGDSIPGEGLVVIEHPGGFRSSYRGIELRPDMDNTVIAGDWLGYTDGDEWTFSITDMERGRGIDPLMSLPSRGDSPVPGVSSLLFSDGADERTVFDGMTLPPGQWTVTIDPAASERAPFVISEISLYWLGQRKVGIRFDSLAEIEGRIVMETPEERQYEAVYDSSGCIILGEVGLNAGRGDLELRIKDDAGRVATRSWRFAVRIGG